MEKNERMKKLLAQDTRQKFFSKRQQNRRHKNVYLRFRATTKVVSNAESPSSSNISGLLVRRGWKIPSQAFECCGKGESIKDNISENPTAFANVKFLYFVLFLLLRHQISMNIIIWNVMCRSKRKLFQRVMVDVACNVISVQNLT